MALTKQRYLGSRTALASCLTDMALAASDARADNRKEDPCKWETSNLAALKNIELFKKADSISDAEVREWSRLLVFSHGR